MGISSRPPPAGAELEAAWPSRKLSRVGNIDERMKLLAIRFVYEQGWIKFCEFLQSLNCVLKILNVVLNVKLASDRSSTFGILSIQTTEEIFWED